MTTGGWAMSELRKSLTLQRAACALQENTASSASRRHVPPFVGVVVTPVRRGSFFGYLCRGVGFGPPPLFTRESEPESAAWAVASH